MKKLLLIVLSLSIVSIAIARDVSLTVYNSNLALVTDTRKIDYQKGTFSYSFENIPSQIIPTSVHFSADGAAVIEQNYEYDLSSAEKISRKFIGTKIRAFTKEGSMFEGTLQPSDGARMVLTDDEGKVQIIQMSEIIYTQFPKMPDDFIAKPTLVWLLNSDKAGNRNSTISYLTEGMNWHAEYIAVTGQDKLGFTGWVSIENTSGETYEDAKLKLMAGEVHRVYPQRGKGRGIASAQAFDATYANKPQFEEKSFFEYHLYTLQRPATLKNNQTKQISLFPEAKVSFEQEYLYEGSRFGKAVKVYLKFKNSKSSGLGMPLPAGMIRVYQQDDDGTQEFIGEDNIDHTPRDEDVKILVGEAFDLVGERIKKDTRSQGRNITEEDIEISLRNHKKEAVEIVVSEYLYGNWKILSSSHTYTKVNDSTIEFKVKVPPHKEDEETLVNYSVRYTRY